MPRSAAQKAAVVSYFPRDGIATAHLPCVRGDSVTYRPLALWKFKLASANYNEPKGSWVRIEIARADETSLTCDDAKPVGPLVGATLESVATYWLIASVNGEREGAMVWQGPLKCADVMIGPAPAGMMATCVVSPGNAMAMFVPDPYSLVP